MTSFFNKAKNLAREHGDKIDKALDKVGDVVDQKTGGKHRDKIDKALGEAKKHTGNGDSTTRP
ncbi:MAG TPA: antitoxin [Mycobacteriales bacterium]|jgi:4-alpha-glucanotransferase|nr:antitoxin [Cryptosporangiaceae bacterium]MDQ1679082.1 hypothetical protein [Actinomycetota bacterium]HEV7756456.1 antitoxin [Mycobacteriales bacterium]